MYVHSFVAKWTNARPQPFINIKINLANGAIQIEITSGEILLLRFTTTDQFIISPRER
ncbi:MAG: hypothetical protein ACJASB_001272 [Shewanella psychromarinicola]|jgi:hypothetical protein